ncbi:hypothetical protein kuro4_28290 [Gelria sp. Kuro-4]|nr:hypothetical protein kuro4_28290 [Gelria sp. Kuro-4]
MAIACANVGVIVGTLMLTGLGFRLSGILVELCKESIPLLLVSSMVVCILLGMGVPTLAVYLVVSIFVAPVLINHGVLPVAVHMFVFYFGVLSCITPPVAVAAYTAAGISGASPMSTGFTAFRLALPSFIIPFMFVYNPALLMMGDPLNILWSFTTSLIGVGFMAAGLEGYLLRQTSVVERGLLIASGLCLIWPGLISDVIGLAVGVSVYLHEYWARQGRISASRIDV